MKLFLFFIISTWTNGSFVTNFSKQYSMRSNVSTKHVFQTGSNMFILDKSCDVSKKVQPGF